MSMRTVPLGSDSERTLFRVGPSGVVRDRIREIDDPRPVIGPFFVLERAIADGTLPPPSEQGPSVGWIAPYHWDFLVYANSAAGSNGGAFYASWRAANAYCGLNTFDAGPGAKERQAARKRDLLPVLEAAGLIQSDGVTAGGNQWYRLQLAPAWTRPRGLVRSATVKTIGSLTEANRPYVMIPNAIMLERRWRSLREHRLRRMLIALYCFNDWGAWGGVDINHLRIDGERLRLSAAFLAAAYVDATAAARLLHELCFEGLVDLTRAPGSTVRPYPASATQMGASSDATVQVLRFVPKLQPEYGEGR
jgi:hypothetical protein